MAVARVVASRSGRRLPEARLRLVAAAGGRRAVPPAVPDGAGPDLLGRAYEALLDGAARRRSGSWFTPPAVASGLVAEAVDGLAGDPASWRVCDPAVGGGAFLLAAARWLHGRGLPRRRIVSRQLHGVDTDALAVAVAEAALALWSAETGETAVAGDHLRAGDGLLDAPRRSFDVVIGNPPFLNQLAAGTARSRPTAAVLRDRYGDAARGYADTAALFLLAGCDLARPGGRVALLQPESVLAGRDAGGVRRAVLEQATLRALWVAGEPVFDAGVRVCAPVLEVGRRPATVVRRSTGAGFRRLADHDLGGDDLRSWPTWAPLAATTAGVPTVDFGGAPRLGERWHATADFRDQYYGLVPFVVDGDGGEPGGGFAPLVTSGLVDPGVCLWGRRPTRFAKRRWQAPLVDLARLRAGSRLAPWASSRLVPKVLVATQTRVLEAAVDEQGRCLPCTPVITVAAAPSELWHVAAAVMAPPVTAWARRTYAGAALAGDAIKLSARQLLDVPLPVDAAAWDEGARLLRAGVLAEFGDAMCRAHGAGHDVLEWWTARLPGPCRGDRPGVPSEAQTERGVR